jgi:hypothetical protein
MKTRIRCKNGNIIKVYVEEIIKDQTKETISNIEYTISYIACDIKKYNISGEEVINAGRKYIEYCNNPNIENLGTENEEEIIAGLVRDEYHPVVVFYILNKALKEANQ